MLNSRQINLLCYLKKEQRFCPAREIAQVLGCSTKTVYNDIALLQKYISRNEWGGMDSKPNCGTRLFLSQKGIAALEREMNEAFLFTAQLEDCTDEIIPILRLLLRRQNVTAEELGNRLHASPTAPERMPYCSRTAAERVSSAFLIKRRMSAFVIKIPSQVKYGVSRGGSQPGAP